MDEDEDYLLRPLSIFSTVMKAPYADPAKLIWRTKDGREIPVIEMDDSHLLNTIAMLSRKLLDTTHPALCQRWITVLNQEDQRRRKEAADKVPDIFQRLLAPEEF